MNDFNYFRPHPKPQKTEKKSPKRIPTRSRHWHAITPKELSYLKQIKELPCIACGCFIYDKYGRRLKSEAHHITEGGRRMGHYHSIPLCPNYEPHNYEGCHEGKICSIGNTKKSFIKKYGSEHELLERTWKRLNFTLPAE